MLEVVSSADVLEVISTSVSSKTVLVWVICKIRDVVVACAGCVVVVELVVAVWEDAVVLLAVLVLVVLVLLVLLEAVVEVMVAVDVVTEVCVQVLVVDLSYAETQTRKDLSAHCPLMQWSFTS